MRLISLAAGMLAAASLLTACSETPGLPAGTYAHFQSFKQAPFHRAYALARHVNGSYSAVYLGNQPSRRRPSRRPWRGAAATPACISMPIRAAAESMRWTTRS